MERRRAHTGRRRNEAARQAILGAALVSLRNQVSGAEVTVETIAAAAGVSKQTIYRWWPSKGAVLLEAMIERANHEAPTRDTGSLRSDLTAFLQATFRSAGGRTTATLLRGVMAEALRDPAVAETLGRFTAERRVRLRQILERGRLRSELGREASLDLMVDQAYGLLWYRVLVGNAPLTADTAAQLASALIRQGC